MCFLLAVSHAMLLYSVEAMMHLRVTLLSILYRVPSRLLYSQYS